MQSVHGLDDEYFALRQNSFEKENAYLGQCMICGWWKISQLYYTDSDWQLWQNFYECCGVIKNLDVADLSTPMSVLRSYLVARYEERWSIHPYKFEQLIADVFRDFGYSAVCTAYSRDAGIDVFLIKDKNIIGVQVKRYRNKIKIEQIRAFLGALLVNNINQGIFISTGEYQAGCHSLSKRFGIELVNGKDFYQRLKEAQLIQSNIDFSPKRIINSRLYYTGSCHMNSL
ncbi:restriction endonuclease [Pedobacter sp. L105]|uniref:restriction endonuclease n=1 Tax=Pedobacter sp. L105 TaxID=1641871 RepID=UPI00131B08CF|nr:restriction endonuclease [Pedobacter sp. L105]